MNLFRFFRHEPALGGLVLVCLLLVGAVIISDWLEKRRTRKLLKLRDTLRAQNMGGSIATTAPGRSAPTPHAGFRIFRWEFVLLSVVCVAIWMPFSKKDVVAVQAKESPAAATSTTEVTIQPAAVSTVSEAAAPEPILSLSLSSPTTIPGKVRFHLADADSEASGSVEPRFRSSLFSASRKTSASRSINLDALFEENSKSEELTALEQSAALSPRDIYPIGNDGFTPKDPRNRMRFGKR